MKATLIYHSIDDSGSPISVSPAVFERHVRALTSGRPHVVSLDTLVSGVVEDDAVAVTFDDAFSNVGGPIRSLLERGVPVTVFVVTGHVGGTNAWGGREQAGIPTLPLLGWDALGDLASAGAQIGLHTRTHPALTHLTPTQVDDELGGGLDDLARHLGIHPPHLAYPYGDVNETVAARAAAHVTWAHTTEHRTLGSREYTLRLPRLDMYYLRRPDGLEGWGTPAFARRIAWHRTRRAVRSRLIGSHVPQ